MISALLEFCVLPSPDKEGKGDGGKEKLGGLQSDSYV